MLRAARNAIAGRELNYGPSHFIIKVVFDLAAVNKPILTVILQKTIGNNHIKLWLFVQESNK